MPFKEQRINYRRQNEKKWNHYQELIEEDVEEGRIIDVLELQAAMHKYALKIFGYTKTREQINKKSP